MLSLLSQHHTPPPNLRIMLYADSSAIRRQRGDYCAGEQFLDGDWPSGAEDEAT